MKISGIYKIQSLIKPERIYIGSSNCISKRWHYHLWDLRRNKHHSKQLQRHYNKYGEPDLMFSVILGCEKEDLIKVEQYFLDSYNPYFNNSKIAQGSSGMKGKVAWNKGKKATPEMCLILSKAHKGQNPWNKDIPLSQEQKDKMSKSLKGRTAWNKGKKYHFHNKRDNSVYKGRIISEETRERMREGVKKRPPISTETREKMRIASLGNKNMVGKTLLDETKKKISESLRGNIPWNKGLKYKIKKII